MITILIQIVTIFVFTLLSAFFSSSEVAFFSLATSKVRGFRFTQDPRKRLVANLLSRSKSLLVTIFMYNTIVNVLLQNASSDMFTDSSGGWLLKVGVPLVLVLFAGELIPKYLGIVHNEKLALAYSSVIVWLEWLITPFRIIITKVSYILSRVCFFFLKAETALSKEELAHILQSSEGKGILHSEELKLIYGMLSLEDKQINELMLPRNEMPIYHLDEPLSKLIHLFSEEKVSEVALFEKPQEKMMGIVRLRDFFIKRQEFSCGDDLTKIMRRPFYIPETTSAKAVLEQLGKQSTDTAWIVDEYGASSGMIREEHLLAKVVEPSLKEEKSEYERISKDTIIASGQLPLDEVRKLFDATLESKYHMATIGGFITERLGSIPAAGTTIEEDGIFIRVLSSTQTVIRKVYIQKVAKS